MVTLFFLELWYVYVMVCFLYLLVSLVGDGLYLWLFLDILYAIISIDLYSRRLGVL